MDFNEYQKTASRTATFEGKVGEYKLMYLCLGLAGESGEVIEKIKHVIRDQDGVMSEEKRQGIKNELGDVLWYLSQLARACDLSFDDVARANIEKLADRHKRGVIKSEGDSR
ncbi:MAG TPA: nucleoside triphosphate pyrophosphohydrolase family protein [Candidatus Paceibacterota bacterium]